MIIFGAIWAHTPFFGLFYLKSYDDEIWYVGTLCDLEYECPNRISKAPVLLPAEVGFPFGRRPKVLLAVGELFVRARSARSQARSACVIARRRRVSIRPKAEGFAFCSGARSFSYLAPILWNSLPVSLRQAEDLGSFKRGLKTHFFAQAF